MGLDMYLEGEKYYWTDWANPDANRKEDDLEVKSLRVKLGYWRKHPDLHGFIVEAFGGGEDNKNEIVLSAQDMRNIISAINEKRLPHTEGFFFGASLGTEEERKEDVAVFEKAIAWIEAGDKKPEQPIEEPIGGGLVMMRIKPEAFAGVKETRDVIYRASW